MQKTASYRLGEKAAENFISGWYNKAKNYVKDITGDFRDTFKTLRSPSPHERAQRMRRQKDMIDIFGKDTDMTPGGHLRGAGYAERLGLPNIEDVVMRGGK